MSAFLSPRSLTALLASFCLLEAAAAEWSQLPSLPDAEGFASPFAGVSGGALIVAGGANIPQDKWADVFTKVWHDRVFILESPETTWITTEKLPRPLGYGVSITADDSVLCLGGSDSQRHYADCFRMRWKDGKLSAEPLPALPQACANACGALVGRTVYLAGGLESPNSTSALLSFWALDLDALGKGWQQLAPWPGPARMLAVAGAYEGTFYLFSGASLSPGPDGKPQRTYLKDAYSFKAGSGWQKLAEIPRATVAAPSPAVLQSGSLQVFSGDDGANVNFTPVTQHPGFPRSTLVYDPGKDAWSELPGLPFSRATVPVVGWRGQFVVPNGEVRPRLRSPEVWVLPKSTSD